MNIKRNQLRRLIESTLINEFFDDVISTGLDLAVKTADVGLDTAAEVLKNPEAESMMTDLIKAAGADKLGIELFKEMFPKSSVFLAYLKSKNVDEAEFTVAFGLVLVEAASNESVSLSGSIDSIDDKLADIVADSVLATLEGMDVDFGAKMFGVKIPGTESFEKKTLKNKTREAIKDAIKPILIQGKKLPPGIVKERLTRVQLRHILLNETKILLNNTNSRYRNIKESIDSLSFLNRAQVLTGLAQVTDGHKSKLVNFLNNELKINDEKFNEIKEMKEDLRSLYNDYKASDDIDALLSGLRSKLAMYI